MSASAPKLSTNLQTIARGVVQNADPKVKILRLYRHVQKQVPHLLKVYAVDEPVQQVRSNIKREFLRHGTANIEPRVADMLIFKGQCELDEAMAQWKTRTHILKYVYDVVYKPHLARSKTPVPNENKVQDPVLAEFFGSDRS